MTDFTASVGLEKLYMVGQEAIERMLPTAVPRAYRRRCAQVVVDAALASLVDDRPEVMGDLGFEDKGEAA